jgi:hypothetical protein
MPVGVGRLVGASDPNPVLSLGAGGGVFVHAANATTTNASPRTRFATLDPPLL